MFKAAYEFPLGLRSYLRGRISIVWDSPTCEEAVGPCERLGL
jgi:hypothetical protein